MLPVASLVPVVQTQIGITFDCFLYLCSPYGERFVGLSGQSERLYLDVDVEPNHPKLLLPQGLFISSVTPQTHKPAFNTWHHSHQRSLTTDPTRQ